MPVIPTQRGLCICLFATKNRPFKPSFVVIAVGQYLGERVYCHDALAAKDQAAKAKYLHEDF